MNNLNCLIVEGNITRLPEFRTTPHGFPVCRIPIAVNHYYKKNGSDDFSSEVSYFDVEAFGKLAEVCAKYSQKGRGVSVVGRIKQKRWKSDDGRNLSKITIVAEKVKFKTRITNDDDETGNGKTTADITDETAVSATESLTEEALENDDTPAVF